MGEAPRDGRDGDCPQLPALLERTRAHHDVREVSADKAYSSVDNHELLERLGVEAYIPFKDNAVINPKSLAWSRHLCEFLLNQERFLPHYHRRSNVESVFAMIKERFGGGVLSRRPTARINEVLAKCVAHNLRCVVKAIFVSGLAPTFWPGAPPTLPTIDPASPLARGRRWRRRCAYEMDSVQKVATGLRAATPALACAWRGSPA